MALQKETYSQEWWSTPLIPALGSQRVDLCEFKPGLQSEFQDNQGTLGLHRDILSQKQLNQKQKPYPRLFFSTLNEVPDGSSEVQRLGRGDKQPLTPRILENFFIYSLCIFEAEYYYVAKVAFKLVIPASVSWVLDLQLCTTMPGYRELFFF